MKYRRIEGATKLEAFIEPMLAQTTDRKAFSDKDWVFEVKWDGYRAVAEVSKNAVKLYSRNGLSFAKAYPRVYEALASLKKEMVIDGEIVVFDENGKPSFQKLQNYSSRSRDVICYYAFDCLSYGGKDLRSLPLLERKAVLRKHLKDTDIIRYCDHVEEDGEALFNAIREQGLEGMIAKKSDSRYQSGKRTPYWLKIRNIKMEEAVIIGFTAPKGSRKGFGSLLLAQYHKKKLVYIGNVGTGFNDNLLNELTRKLTSIARATSPLDESVAADKSTTWVTPRFVCQVKYTEKTSEGILRHPVFLGLRVDKTPAEVKFT